MTVNKLTYPSKENAVQEKINEIIDNLGSSTGANIDLSNLSVTGEAHFQAPLVSGTNIKTINSNSLLGSGDISVLQNSGSISRYSLGILGAANSLVNDGTWVGASSQASNCSTALGMSAKATGQYATAVGWNAIASSTSSIQIGYGTNSTSSTMAVGFEYLDGSTVKSRNWTLLNGTTGIIPNDRLNTATSSSLGIVQPDNSTITVDANGVITTEAVKDNRSGSAIKTWTGTKAQYDAIATKDSNTLYNITDDTLNLNNVANTNLSNLTDTGKIAIAHNAMPSNTFVDISFPATDTTFTAPADGFYNFVRRVGATTSETERYLIALPSYGGRFAAVGGLNWQELCLWVPVKKNDTVFITYNATGEIIVSRFIYAQGSESEAS